ncbi:MAG: hypothetical protein DHS20C10_06710 [marine bacterium B5-7]|nr:MAG: hypothetical protein DHS20C10_06710 [marine bacterium B5-7]
MTARRFHITNDPVHGAMQFPMAEWRWIKPFLDSDVVQRLRHIKQLGFTDYLFPGAVHTRFNHSLGCCYVGNQIAKALGLDDKQRQIVSIACLLHDIGHGPFSHAFEETFIDGAISHESWTPLFLRAFLAPDFLSEYAKQNPQHPLNEKDLALIGKLICHEPNEESLLADIVSSQLDADRLDYLLRDSHFCGVNYGRYDFRWLLHCLEIVNVDGQSRLGVNTKGIGAVEQYLMARRLMTHNIYHHPRKHAAEYYLRAFLRCYAEDLQTDVLSAQMRAMPLGQLLQAVYQFNQSVPTAEAVKDFREKNFNIYRWLCDYDVQLAIRHAAQDAPATDAAMLASRLFHRQLPRVFPIAQSDLEAMKNRVEQVLADDDTLRPWQLVVLNPALQAYSAQQDPIAIQSLHDGKVSHLQDDSIMIGALSDKPEYTAILCVDKEILDKPAVQALV